VVEAAGGDLLEGGLAAVAEAGVAEVVAGGDGRGQGDVEGSCMWVARVT